MDPHNPATIVLPNGSHKLAGDLTDDERANLLLERATSDRSTMLVHASCPPVCRCPVKRLGLAPRQSLVVPAA